MRTHAVLSLAVLAFLLAAGIGSSAAQQQAPPPPSKFKLTTSAFSEAAQIPNQFTCADPNVASPPLQWSNPPAAAVSFALVFHDTDGAPAKGTMDVTHWILWNIPAGSTQLAGSVKPDASPDGIV